MPPEEVISQPGGAGTQREFSGEKQSNDRRSPGFEPTEDEKKVVGVWLTRVARSEDEQKTKEWRESLEKLRRYERGTQTVDDKKSRTNMVFATMAAMLPELYAKNPTISVTPTDAVSEQEMGKVKRFCATAEKVIRKMLVEEGKLKKRSKANIRATSVTSFGVLKAIYQKEYRGDPVVVRRIDDTQDNLARVEALILDLQKTDDPSELAKKRDELQANLKALSSGNEIRIFKGFVIDRMKSEDFLVLDDNVDEFDEYVDARALGHKIWMPVGQARQFFGMELIGATRYGRPRTDAGQKTDDTPADDQFICVVEIWDKENGVVRTTAKGMNRWLREPYTPPNAPQRWYPFYVLGFNLTEGQWRPLSDVELLMSLQDEYDRTRQNYADVREKAVPKRIVRKGGNLSEQDVKNLVDSGNKEWVAVEGNPAQPIHQDVMDLPGLKIDPQAYDVSQIRNDMDLVSGRSDASRANLIKPKTATEAEIMQEAMQSRVGERRDTNEDLMSEMAEASLEVVLRDLTKPEVVQLAGGDVEWPESPETVETIFRMVSVQVRAGSSGRPNQQREREQWGTLLPVIKETMQQVADLRMQGNFDMAEALIELLRETVRRYDEHLDLDAIIPPIEKDENGKPVAQKQAAMELVKTKEALQQCQEELAKLQQDLQKAQAGEQAKLAQIEADKQAKVAQADVDQVREQAAAEREKAKAEGEASFQRWKATLDAATKVITAELTASISANAGDEAAQEEAVKSALSEERMASVIKDLNETMTKLGSALERVGQSQQQGAGE